MKGCVGRQEAREEGLTDVTNVTGIHQSVVFVSARPYYAKGP